MNQAKSLEWSGLRAEVMRGNMSPVDAEAKAQALGLDPFEKRPDPNEFDPIVETYWSLAMAVAWIAWRHPDQVRQSWDKFRQEYRSWAPEFRFEEDSSSFTVVGHYLERKPHGTIHAVSLAATYAPGPTTETWLVEDIRDYSRPRRMEVRAARDLLWKELIEGRRLAAVALKDGEATSCRIPAHDFEFLEVQATVVCAGKPDEADALHSKFDVLGRASYHHVRLMRAEVMKLWPMAGDRRPPRRSGRKPGGGAYVDNPHLIEMKSLLDNNLAKSIWDAAGQVAPRAPGSSEHAKQKRLAKKYPVWLSALETPKEG